MTPCFYALISFESAGGKASISSNYFISIRNNQTLIKHWRCSINYFSFSDTKTLQKHTRIVFLGREASQNLLAGKIENLRKRNFYETHYSLTSIFMFFWDVCSVSNRISSVNWVTFFLHIYFQCEVRSSDFALYFKSLTTLTSCDCKSHKDFPVLS